MSRPDGIVDFRPDPELFPFESRWFESSVGPLHYVDEGAGRPIVLFHGNPDWSFLYRDIISGLKDRFRLIAMDYPGFGLSVHPTGSYGYTPAEHAAVVAELIEHLDLHDAIVMGADWGGPIGLDVATRFADRVSGLVIGNTWFWPAEGGMLSFFSRLMSLRPLQWLIRHRNLFVSPAMKRTLQVKMTKEAFAHYSEVVPTPESRRGIAEFPIQIRASEAWLADLERRVMTHFAGTPIVVVWGMKDWVFKNVLSEWERRFPHAEVTRLPHASHFVQEDAPAEIVAAIEAAFANNREEPSWN